MKNYVLKYGLLAAAISITLGLTNWFTVAQYYGPSVSNILGYLSIIIGLLCIPLGIKYHRDQLSNGLISFNKALSVGLGITFIASLIKFLYSMLFFIVVGDRFDEWKNSELSAAELKELQLQMAQTPDFVYSAWFQGFTLFLIVFIIGLIISVISAIIMKRHILAKPS